MSAFRCQIITIGDELINGVRVDTNTAWLGERLTGLGMEVERAISIGDDESAIKTAVKEVLDQADVIIVSGGLGPTQDDRTKQAMADLFGVEMERRSEVEKAVRGFFSARGREPTPVNLDQALVPEGFEFHVNPLGTAPGMLKRQGKSLLFFLPGVPSEMKALYQEWVEPILAETYGGQQVYERRWYRTTGIGESDLFDRIGGLEDLAPEVMLSYLPGPSGVSLYLTGRGDDRENVNRRLDKAESRVIDAAGSCLYARENLDIPEKIARLLLARGEKVAVAESCTGGLISHSLTDIPGASDWFEQGWVTYSNEAKEVELGISVDLMIEHGAVSEEVARAMAEGARERAGTDWALSVTGVAGPTGGTEDKPVGLTYIACAGRDETVARRFLFGAGGRARNKSRSMAVALDLLRRMLEGLDPCEGGWEVHR